VSTPKEHSAMIVRRFFEDVFTKGDRKLADEILAPDMAYYGPDEGIHGIDNFFQIVNVMRDTLNVQFVPETIIVEDPTTAAVVTTISGEHVKNFRGIPAKGGTFSLPRVDNFLIVDGKIKEVRAVFDHQTMFQILQEGKKQGQRQTAGSAR